MILQLPINKREVVVLFRLSAHIWADSIYLVGDFNGWSTTATPMRLGEQYWEARLTLSAGSRYYYAYLVDGKDWCTEQQAVAVVGSTPQPVAMLPIEIPQARRMVDSH